MVFLRVKTGVPVPVDFVPVPDPTRKTSTRTRPIPAGTGRVYPRVRVDPHTSNGDMGGWR